ncbi:TetR/AcrR family transcriptional regulator [Cellulomonas sp. URHE0023]|uniref:TetR/AcrR family transcriptional regulator n=1 Tax=Cellulomonas sp. URHE0023 TaxID=1380354 RepID=UPI00068F24D1|nr:TetR/AcrR family transcriptional regulator [Cellulomonas sp. URHE0023]
METAAPAKGRAAPLPPDERRAAILLAIQPVLLERGAGVTTRELAEAAGVAEGTLFRVFTDKVTLIRAAIWTAIDPADAVPEIDAVDRTLPLRDRLIAVMRLGFARMDVMMRWMTLLHEVTRNQPAPEDNEKRMQEWGRQQDAGSAAVRAAVERVIGPDASSLRMPVDQAVALFTTVLMGATMQAVDARRRNLAIPPPDAEQLVDLVLHGVVLIPPPAQTGSPERSA